MNCAHKHGRLTRPVVVELPEAPEPRDVWLTRNQAARLLRAALCNPKVRLYLPLFILIALYTGRRTQAILALRWHQVNLDTGIINFEQGRRTNKRKGAIPIPPRLLPHLIRARKRGTDLGYVLHINGERIGDIRKGFEAACTRACLGDVTPHTLKHTAITWAMQSGIKRQSSQATGRGFDPHRPLQKSLKMERIRGSPGEAPPLACGGVTLGVTF